MAFRGRYAKVLLIVSICSFIVAFNFLFNQLQYKGAMERMMYRNEGNWARVSKVNISSSRPYVQGIPHIIHQTYKDVMVPSKVTDFVKTAMKLNPGWQYYFWTDVSARKLVSDRHPTFLSTWDNYDVSIKRGDALRYVVLYEYGGVYIDMDVEMYRPLDSATNKYSCIIPPEPCENSVFIFGINMMVNNAIMLCRPKHPFFMFMLEKLVETADLSDVMFATGPSFVTNSFLEFYGLKQEYIDVKSVYGEGRSLEVFARTEHRGSLNPNNSLCIGSPEFFNAEPSARREKAFIQICNSKSKTQHESVCCDGMYRKGLYYYFHRETYGGAFMAHRWVHLWMETEDSLKAMKYIDIHEVIPEAFIYSSSNDLPKL